MPALNLSVLSPSTAPEKEATALRDVEKKYGFIPNLYGVFAHAPSTLSAYNAISDAFQGSSLTAQERNVVLLATSRENDCSYCVAVHSTVADLQKDPPAVTDAIRSGAIIADQKLEALRHFTELVVRNRSHLEDTDVAAFVAAGYKPEQALEVLVGVTLKTLSNYTNHLTQPPLDAAFAPRAWKSATEAR